MSRHNFVLLEIRNADADWSPAGGTRSIMKAEDLEDIAEYLDEKTGRDEEADRLARRLQAGVRADPGTTTLTDGGEPDA